MASQNGKFSVKAKPALDYVKRARQTSFKATATAESGKDWVWTQPLCDEKSVGLSKTSAEGKIRAGLRLLVECTQKKRKLFSVFMSGDNLITWSKKPPLKSSSYPPKKLRIGVLSSLMLTFQIDGPQVLEKDIPGL